MTGITSTGIGSGLDIKSLVASLVAAEQTPATLKLDKLEAKLTTQVSSYGNLKSVMATFQSSLSGLKNLSTFQKLTATSSDTATVTASAFSNADLASYNLEVKQLAKGQTLATPALASATSVLGTGTLTIKFGTTTFDTDGKPTGFAQDGNKGTLTLAVDSTNNTLAGLSEAINKAKAGVTAVVVTDTSGSRLVLNSTDTGAKSSMEISVADDDLDNTDTSGLSALAFNVAANNMTQAQTAQDAKLAINGLEILSSSNTVNTAIKGLSFNLQQAQPGKIVTVGVSQNNDDIAKAVDSFVKGYNALITLVKPMTSYNALTQTGGLLQGDSTVRSAMSKLRAELGSMVSGLNGSAKSLADIGISTKSDGTMLLNSNKLNSQLASNRSGVTGVFAVLGIPSNSNVVFSSSTTATQAGQYAVNITQTAAQGVLNGAAPPPAYLTVGPGIDTFAIKLDGIQSGAIALTQKTYASGTDLATEMQSRINGDSTIKASGVSVGVTYDGSKMVFTSKSYGASSQVEVTANTTTLGLSIGAGTAGKDVAGTIGGQSATGKGRELTATAGDPNGLKLIISDNTTGTKGTVDFSRGLIERLDKVMSGALAKAGSFDIRTGGLQKGLDTITKDRAKLADRMAALEARLYKQFNAMDALLGTMQSTASYLQQLYNPTTKTTS